MRTAIAACFASLLLATAATAQSAADTQLVERARPFLTAENPDGSPEKIDETVACVMAVLSPLPENFKEHMLEADGFEGALNVAVGSNPDLMKPLEACF